MRKIILIIIALIAFSVVMNAEIADSIKIFRADGVEIKSSKITTMNKTLQRDNYDKVLNNFGFNLIRKGTFFAQDIYSDGFKRDNINVIIDGERYHSACPNRMDSPLTRVNPSDINIVEFSKSATDNNASIGGKVEFSRIKPSPISYALIEASGISAGNNAIDLSGDFNMKNNKVSVRYSDGLPYLDGEGRSFKDLYGYKEDFNYSLFEAAYFGKKNDFEWRASIVYNTDIQFPYLQMDEVENSLASGFVSYKGNKLYFNFTDHLMNNTLRQSTMFMESAAKNATVGLNGNFFDLFFRNWDVTNEMQATMMGTEMLITQKNDMIPNLMEFGANLNHSLDLDFIRLSGKAGLNYQKTADVNDAYFENVYASHSSDRLFVIAALSAGREYLATKDFSIGANFDFALDVPSSEQLFIKVQRMMNKPNWLGNSTLDQPFRSGVRMNLNYHNFSLEGFANHIYNFVDLNAIKLNTATYQSYYNTTALLAGFNFAFKSNYFDFETIYNWGENIDTKEPLAEIRPLAIIARIKYSPIENLNLALIHNYENAQKRVASSLKEFQTPTWNRIDFASSYSIKSLRMYLEIENLFGHTYYRHLSFARNPFSAGIPVMESGRLFRLSFSYNYGF